MTQSFEKKPLFYIKVLLAQEHDLGSCWRGKVKNKTSKLHYVIKLFFFFAPFFVSLLFFSTRRHSISLLSTDSRTWCYLILFGRGFTSIIRPMIPTDDKIQNSKSGNFTVRKMRSYWNYLGICLTLVIPSEDLKS